MNLLNALFSLPNLRGEIALYKKGSSGGARFINLSELPAFENEKDWYYHVTTHDRNLIKSRGSIKSSQQFTTLWCDIDLVDKKPIYPSVSEIQKVLDVLISEGMKPSALVHSGGGFHIYWFLDKPEETHKYPSACKAWINYLQKRFNEILNREISIDQVGDMARVLRLPGTVNTTHGKFVRTLTLDSDLRYDLNTLLEKTDYNKKAERGTGETAVKNKLLEAMGSVKASVPSYTENIIYSCNQVKNFFKQGGDVPEPIWYSMAGLLPYTEDGLPYFMNLSQIAGSDAALAKIEQWKQASTGPATCDRLHSHEPSICQGCPHFGKITSPIQLGYSKPTVVKLEDKQLHAPKKSFTIEEESYIREYVPPQPFLFDSKGAMCASVEDSAGATKVKVICHNKVIPYKRIWSEEHKQEIVYFNIQTPNDGWREVDLLLSSLQGNCPGLNRVMGAGALVVNGPLMANYLTHCVKYMQELKKVNQSYSRIGWRNATDLDNHRDLDDRFVLGDITFYKSGEVKQESLVPDLKKSLKDLGMKGDVDAWKQAISIFAKPGFEKHLICFMGAFAVPLFRSTDYSGLMVNLLSRDSGSFKSFTLRAITSVYGSPDEKLILSRDSEKSIYAKIANRCDLPITYDEITNIDREELSDLAYAVTQGRRGDRLNQDSTLKVNDSIWRTVMFCSSNASLDDMLSGKNLAERMRLLELPINVAELNHVEDSEARSVMDVLNQNYGQAGVLWLKYVMDNRESLFKECVTMISELTKITKSRNDKRFWISYLAFTLVAARHTRLLGLHSFSVEGMAATCNEILTTMSSKVSEDETPLAMYAHQYLISHLDNTLTVQYNSLTARTGDVIREPRSELTIKIESRSNGPGVRDKVGYISRKAMQNYLTEMRVTFKDFMNELRYKNILIEDNIIKRITMPNSSEVFRLTCFALDLNRLDELFLTESESIDNNSILM